MKYEAFTNGKWFGAKYDDKDIDYSNSSSIVGLRRLPKNWQLTINPGEMRMYSGWIFVKAGDVYGNIVVSAPEHIRQGILEIMQKHASKEMKEATAPIRERFKIEYENFGV